MSTKPTLPTFREDDTVAAGGPCELTLGDKLLGWLPVGEYRGEEIRRALTTRERAYRCACGKLSLDPDDGYVMGTRDGHGFKLCCHMRVEEKREDGP